MKQTLTTSDFAADSFLRIPSHPPSRLPGSPCSFASRPYGLTSAAWIAFATRSTSPITRSRLPLQIPEICSSL